MSSTTSNRNLRCAALPMDVRPDDAAGNLERALCGIDAAAERGATLCLLPEMFATSFPAAGVDAEALLRGIETTAFAWRAIEERARVRGIHVAGTGFAVGDGALPRNRFRLVGPSGVVLEHDKLHLFTPTAEHLAFERGQELAEVARIQLGAGAICVAPAICYDLRFGFALEHLAGRGVEVLLVPAQWAAARRDHFRALVVGRAVELQCFVVACNRSGAESVGRRELVLEYPGNALVASPDGRVLVEGDGSGELVVAELDLGRVAAIRREVPVGRDARRDLVRP